MKDLLILGALGFAGYYIYTHYLSGAISSPVAPVAGGSGTPPPSTAIPLTITQSGQAASTNPIGSTAQYMIQPIITATPVNAGTAQLDVNSRLAPILSNGGGMMTFSSLQGLGTYLYPMTRWAA